MLRIIHTADVHLGARHDDLGEQAAAQRERQFAAFKATVDLALAEKVDLFLIAGDLFDSNVQPRRSVERVAAELKRLAEAKIRTVIIPGTHDCYDRASIYRAYDLPALAGSDPDDDLVTVLDPDHPSVHLAACDVVVHGPVFATKRRRTARSRDLGRRSTDERGRDLARRHDPRLDRDPGQDRRATTSSSRPTRSPPAASTTSPSGTGTRASRRKAGAVTYAYAGAPEPVALDQDRAGKVLLVDPRRRRGRRPNGHGRGAPGRPDPLREARAGRRRRSPASRPSSSSSAARADPDLVLDVRLVGVRPDELDLHLDEIETALGASFLKVRVRDAPSPALTEGALPSPDTIAGAFIRDLEARIAELEASRRRRGRAAPGRRAARRASLGRLLLAGHEVSL